MLQHAGERAAAVQDMVGLLAEDLVPAREDLALMMCDEMHAAVPELPASVRDQTLETCRAHLDLVTSLLRTGQDPVHATAPAEAMAYARDAVHNGISLEAIVRKYRVGHAVFSREILRMLQRRIDDPLLLGDAIALTSDWTFRYVDAVSSAATETYQDERERWVRSAAATRAEEVRLVLDGTRDDGAEASRRLGYDLGRRHLAFVCWTAEGRSAGGVLGALERLAHGLGRALGGQDVLCAPLGADVMGAWATIPSAPDLTQLTSAMGAVAADVGASVALGEPHEGLDGFRRSHEEAMRARRVARLLSRPAGSVVAYSDMALNALLTDDVDEAARFVGQVLGPLASDEDSPRRLAATLRVFYDEGSSFTRTARRLGLHQNTVAYRVRRAGELLGHPVTDRQLETWLALRLADVLRRASVRPA